MASTQSESSSRSTTDWQRLSERGQAILRLIATPILLGYSEQEVARELGTTKRWVSRRLDELRDEVERLALPR